jgi:hypothetical protein
MAPLAASVHESRPRGDFLHSTRTARCTPAILLSTGSPQYPHARVRFPLSPPSTHPRPRSRHKCAGRSPPGEGSTRARTRTGHAGSGGARQAVPDRRCPTDRQQPEVGDMPVERASMGTAALTGMNRQHRRCPRCRSGGSAHGLRASNPKVDARESPEVERRMPERSAAVAAVKVSRSRPARRVPILSALLLRWRWPWRVEVSGDDRACAMIAAESCRAHGL